MGISLGEKLNWREGHFFLKLFSRVLLFIIVFVFIYRYSVGNKAIVVCAGSFFCVVFLLREIQRVKKLLRADFFECECISCTAVVSVGGSAVGTYGRLSCVYLVRFENDSFKYHGDIDQMKIGDVGTFLIDRKAKIILKKVDRHAL